MVSVCVRNEYEVWPGHPLSRIGPWRLVYAQHTKDRIGDNCQPICFDDGHRPADIRQLHDLFPPRRPADEAHP